MSKPRILIADDHVLLAEGIAGLLRTQYDIVAMCANGRELLDMADTYRPDVITLDIGMPEMNGLEAARRLGKSHPRIRMVCVTQQVDLQYLIAAVNAGVKGFVAKQSASGELQEAVRRVLLNQTYITPLLRHAYDDMQLSGPDRVKGGDGSPLTPRQREILQMIAEGKATKEIAFDLNISTKTVEFHRGAIMKVLGLRSVAELTRYALKHGISMA